VNTLDNTLVILKAEAFIPHPKYEDRKVYFDAGIVVTKTSISYNDFIRPICLPGAYAIKLVSLLLTEGKNKLERWRIAFFSDQFNICRYV
jgi:Trypsin